MRYARYVAAMSLIAMLSAPMVQARSSKTSALFESLWNSLAAGAESVTVIPDHDFMLIRRGDRLQATIVGEFDASTYSGDLEILAQRDGWATAWVTRQGMARLEEDRAVTAIYPPLKFHPLEVVTEGRATMGWDAYHAKGVGGQGVRVAVIDQGFGGHQERLGVELPSSVYHKSFISPATQALFASEVHGTAVAEIVHDIAPDAELILLAISTTSEFINAVSWCIDHNVNVVNMSLGFTAGPRDGTSVVAAEVDRAAAAGIIWVNSAGNEGYAHWGGEWADDNANNYLDFSPGVELIQIQWTSSGGILPTVTSELIWDQWPTTENLSFDIEVYFDPLRTQLLTSSNSGPVYNLAFRRVELDNPVAGNTYYVAIKRVLGTPPANLRMEFYSDDYTTSMQPRNSGSSLSIPADARGAIAVGAYDYGQVAPGTDPIRPYSSQGPTWDGRGKPEIVAADGVSTLTYGSHDFFGTSAASPHIAGVAALLSSATVSGGLFTYVWSPADFRRLLAVNSIDFGPVGTDSIYGDGGIVLPPASASPDSFKTARAYPNPSNASLEIAFAARPGTSYALRIYDVLGRLVWQTEALHVGRGDAKIRWAGKDQQGRAVGSGVYFYRIDTDTQTLTGKAVILK